MMGEDTVTTRTRLLDLLLIVWVTIIYIFYFLQYADLIRTALAALLRWWPAIGGS